MYFARLVFININTSFELLGLQTIIITCKYIYIISLTCRPYFGCVLLITVLIIFCMLNSLANFSWAPPSLFTFVLTLSYFVHVHLNVFEPMCMMNSIKKIIKKNYCCCFGAYIKGYSKVIYGLLNNVTK